MRNLRGGAELLLDRAGDASQAVADAANETVAVSALLQERFSTLREEVRQFLDAVRTA
jgi:hypothetical protein